MKGRTALVALAVMSILCTVGGSAQATPATPSSISGAPVPVYVLYGSFNPAIASIYYYHARAQPDSGMVTWTFGNPSSTGDMTVTDSTGLNLYNSRKHHSPYSFSVVWKWAGTYRYHSSTTGTNGKVKVYMVGRPARAALGTTFVLKWAHALRTNCVFDVEVRRPGSTHWGYLTFGTRLLSEGYRPGAKGFYAIRARMRNTISHKASGFSPIVFLGVT